MAKKKNKKKKIKTKETKGQLGKKKESASCLLYTSPSPRDQRGSRMPSSA